MTVEERGQMIFDHLALHEGRKFRLPELAQALGLEPGAKTAAGLRRAREIATASGYHFPPAVPQNGFTYTVTRVAEEAIEPAGQMDAIAKGVKQRADVGWDYLRRHQREIKEPHLRASVRAQLRVRQTIARAMAELQATEDDLVADLMKLSKEQRKAAEANGR